jgi:uncharacterized protein
MRLRSACFSTTAACGLGLATVLLAGAADAQAPAEPPRTLTVQGVGQATATPDLAVVGLAVETEAAEASQAVAENARRTQQVIEALRGLMADEDRLTTTGYSLQPRYRQPPPTPERPETGPQIVGYQARNQVRVELHDLAQVGRAIDAATTAGANRVDHLQFLLAERGPALRSALATAAAEARAQAESVAAALGVTLGPVLEASTVPGPVMPRQVMARAEAMVAPIPTPVEPGEVTVTTTLQVTYRIDSQGGSSAPP